MRDQYEFLVCLLHEYRLRQLIRYENDVIQLSNNCTYRKADPVDHLEMIMAQTRLATMEKVSADLYRLIELSREK